MTIEEDIHFSAIRDSILDGDLVPFLGAGVNLCGRPPNEPWKEGTYLPSGGELAERLAADFSYKPEWGNPKDLLRVCQFIATVRGTRPLFLDLHRCFNADYPFTPVHRFLAGLPGQLRSRGYPYHPMLIATTNYDDVMERAFSEAGERYDVVTYICEGKLSGRFVHRRVDGQRVVIESPNEYDGGLFKQVPVIFKLHGTVERRDRTVAATAQTRGDESFVITEDHYIDYLARASDTGLIPAEILGKLSISNILFLGYSLGDWNLRILLQRIWLERELTANCWAVNAFADYLEQEIWKKRGVQILRLRLEHYFGQLTGIFDDLPAAAEVPAPAS
ncbi:MAG: SIR2 family NAD-dependent protein deacylase [Limisphaerales bacterium]